MGVKTTDCEIWVDTPQMHDRLELRLYTKNDDVVLWAAEIKFDELDLDDATSFVLRGFKHTI